ncbi:hypothetical protein CDL15_Pgr008535 [Punica granatum]|uniref:Uncharacterized protein n=1 Tax=Punica granatum TaxID=22663 RepID=A0A218WQF6_PUNGR|nr:hypothetical protein CDL15_Pgr008535 [Punica granatum]
MAKKKRRPEPEVGRDGSKEIQSQDGFANGEFHDSEDRKKEMKQKKNKKKRKSEKNVVESKEIPTVSIAVPGSIIDNAQSLELATRLAGQIARAATIFRIDEVVVFNNKDVQGDDSGGVLTDDSDENESGAAFLIRILRYLETPQYLRKALFPRHNNLRVTLKEKPPNFLGTLVDVGLNKNVVIDQVIEPGTRVTVAMGIERNLDSELPHLVVSSLKPREDEGRYWGYKVRYASSISSVLNECPYQGGYDHLIGTSEHGMDVRSSELVIPTFRHLLIAFGGLAGLEESIEEDSNLKGKHAREIFDKYLNTCPHQGSRTIRTEEAIFISLQYFQEPIGRALEAVEHRS